jgi:acetate CoA/acetoacetate CoA-transferase alpha subunit
MGKLKSVQEAVQMIPDGASILINGFYQQGAPEDIIDEILAQKKKNLTLYNNDAGEEFVGLGKLIYAGLVKKLVCSWCGLNPLLPKLVESGKIELELNPQGTFVERIRAGGYGLGGILTPTGLGTIVEEKGWGKRVNLGGKDMLYHEPIRADFCLLEAYEADWVGNLIFRRTQRCFGPVMATAADVVIASVVTPIQPIGALEPDHIMVPGQLVDVLVQQRR